MITEQKIDLTYRLFDELAVLETNPNESQKISALNMIREHLQFFELPLNKTKADITIIAIKNLATINFKNIDKQLLGIAELTEKASTELYKIKAYESL